MTRRPPKDFYQIQREQWRVSLALFAAVLAFYVVAMSTVIWLFVLLLEIMTAGTFFSAGRDAIKVFGAAALVAVVLAALHFRDARRHGGRFIIERLGATLPDKSDRYHRQAVNLVEEMRIAGGLPAVRVYVIPSFAINSMAVMDDDATPAVLVTEGMLAGLEREELQAVVAHELAHIIRGDTFYLTMVCSLVNIFERLRESLEAGLEDRPQGRGQGGDPAGMALPLLAGVTISNGAMRLLSILISRRRETLADATAVEMTRQPMALAQAIFKAHLKYSFVGDFRSSYSPLFIVDPESEGAGYGSGWLGTLFSTHPPLDKRLATLAAMAHATPEAVMEAVWHSQKRREAVRGIVKAEEEVRGRMTPGGGSTGWMICENGGAWRGPMPLEDLLLLPWFSPLARVRPADAPESEAAPARRFRDIRRALGFLADGPLPQALGKKGLCPRCHAPLVDAEYEGAPIRRCGACGGKAAAAMVVARVLARREVNFSERLCEKAAEFLRENIIHPDKMGRREHRRLTCPECGVVMLARPYSYQYFIMVDRCMACQTVWFDADELELLQILVERSQRERAGESLTL